MRSRVYTPYLYRDISFCFLALPQRSEPSLMTYCGDLTVGLMFEPGTENHKDKKKRKKFWGKLHIKLKGARNLSAKDSSGFSDPFVKR